MKILLISPPFYRLQGATLIHYPAGSCSMAGSLEKEGYSSLVYNADYDANKKTILGNTNHLRTEVLIKEHKNYLKRLNDLNDPVWLEIRNFIKDYRPDVLGISAFNITLSSAHMTAKIAKLINPNIITVMEGCTNRGIFCAIDPAKVADFNLIDFAISREPEITIIELIKALEQKKTDFSHIDGLTWKKDGKIVRNKDRGFVKDLDQLPFPARHLIHDYEKMAPHAFQGIYGSRGCPFQCVFCGCHVSCGYKPRTRSAKNMVDEIEYVHKKFKTHYFYICDDIFFINKERAKEFCRLLTERNLKVVWSCQSRAEMLDDEILALVKRAGGQHIAVGVETGNERIRALMKKGNTLDDVRRCAQLIKKHKLYMVAFCMIGLPWEGEREIQDTVNFIEEIDPYIVFPYLATPSPGTELDEMIHEDDPRSKELLKDLCHSDPAKALSRYIPSETKVRVINKALVELNKLNKRSLFKNFFARPKFYWYFVQDINLFKNPRHLISYIWDYFGQ